jgi:hypothetical protein
LSRFLEARVFCEFIQRRELLFLFASGELEADEQSEKRSAANKRIWIFSHEPIGRVRAFDNLLVDAMASFFELRQPLRELGALGQFRAERLGQIVSSLHNALEIIDELIEGSVL